MVLHHQILFSLAIATIAEAILMWTSAEQVPSLHRVAPRYLQLVTSSKFWPFMLISALMLFVLLTTILLFSVLTAIQYSDALSTRLLVRSWSSSLLPPIRSTSIANRRSHMGLPPMEMDVCSISCMLFSTNKLNRMGESKHPWRTSVVLKNSPGWLFKRTALLEISYSAWMAWASPSCMLKLLRTCQWPACQTLSNAFLKSLKLWNRSRWCRRCFTVMTRFLKICFTVFRPGLKPAWSSASSLSALALSWLRIRDRFTWALLYEINLASFSPRLPRGCRN